MLDRVLDFELVGVAARPIVHLPSLTVVAQHLLRVPAAVSPPGLPRLDPTQLVGLARDEARWPDLERLWQKVSLARAGVICGRGRIRCVLPVDPVAFDGSRWSPEVLGRLAERYGRDPSTMILEIDLRDRRLDVGATSRFAATLRRAGFRVAVRVPAKNPSPWRVAQAHWVVVDACEIELARALAEEAAARGAKLLVADVDDLERAAALREAGVPYASGAVFGPARGTTPGGVDRKTAAGLRARAGRRRGLSEAG